MRCGVVAHDLLGAFDCRGADVECRCGLQGVACAPHLSQDHGKTRDIVAETFGVKGGLQGKACAPDLQLTTGQTRDIVAAESKEWEDQKRLARERMSAGGGDRKSGVACAPHPIHNAGGEAHGVRP